MSIQSIDQGIDQGSKQIKDDLAETLSLLAKLKQSSEQQEVRDVVTLVVSLQHQKLSGDRLLEEAPQGRITPNASLHHDNITGRSYQYNISFYTPSLFLSICSCQSVYKDLDQPELRVLL